MPMLDRVGVNIIEMAFEIGPISNAVLDESFLPHPTVPLSLASRCGRAFGTTGGKVITGETLFDRSDSNGIIRISLRQSPDHMEVFGQ